MQPVGPGLFIRLMWDPGCSGLLMCQVAPGLRHVCAWRFAGRIRCKMGAATGSLPFRRECRDHDVSKESLPALQVIDLNSADYTAWAWRWKCILALGQDLESEVPFMNHVATTNPKNYQLWNHRRRFAFKRGAAQAQTVGDVGLLSMWSDFPRRPFWTGAGCSVV